MPSLRFCKRISFAVAKSDRVAKLVRRDAQLCKSHLFGDATSHRWRRLLGPSVLDVGYVGSKGVHLDNTVKKNELDPGFTAVQSCRPYQFVIDGPVAPFGLSRVSAGSIRAPIPARVASRLGQKSPVRSKGPAY
jgi:hypothetical protein